MPAFARVKRAMNVEPRITFFFYVHGAHKILKLKLAAAACSNMFSVAACLHFEGRLVGQNSIKYSDGAGYFQTFRATFFYFKAPNFT
jgi:hypothetical protein